MHTVDEADGLREAQVAKGQGKERVRVEEGVGVVEEHCWDVEQGQKTKQEEEVDKLLMVAADAGSQSSLRVIELSNFLEDGPFFLIGLRLKFLSQFVDIRHSPLVI